MRFIVFLLISLLFVSLVQGLPHSNHQGFANHEGRLALQEKVITIHDDAIYFQGWYSTDQTNWISFTFPDAQTDGWILDGSATKTITLPDITSTENYLIIYSCTDQITKWDCHSGQWQLHEFALTKTPDPNPKSVVVAIIDVSASTEDPGYSPKLTLDGNTAAESRWSGEHDGAWIAYELNQTTSLNHIRLAFHRGNERHNFFSIETSLDGQTWTRQLDHKQSESNTLELQRFTFPEVQARYVRVVGHGNDGTYATWNSYTEMSIDNILVDLDTAVTPGPVEQGDIELIFWQDFQDNAVGGYPVTTSNEDWNDPDRNFRKTTTMRQEGDNIFMRSKFEPDTFSIGNGSGFIVYDKLPQGYEELYLTYKVRFSYTFASEKLHGKLPGLMGDKRCVGGSCLPDGTNGFSTRLMFHNTAVGFYIYHMDTWNATWYRDIYYKKLGYYPTGPIPGEEYVGSSVHFDDNKQYGSGVWHEVTQRVVMNDVGKSNAIVEGFYNGKLAAQRTDIRFRTVDTLQIDRIDVANFLGGSGDRPVTTGYIDFDDFALFRYKSDAPVPHGHEPSSAGRTLVLPTPP